MSCLYLQRFSLFLLYIAYLCLALLCFTIDIHIWTFRFRLLWWFVICTSVETINVFVSLILIHRHRLCVCIDIELCQNNTMRKKRGSAFAVRASIYNEHRFLDECTVWTKRSKSEHCRNRRFRSSTKKNILRVFKYSTIFICDFFFVCDQWGKKLENSSKWW